jgi:O-antigen ligase
MRKIVYRLSLVLIFMIPWEGVVGFAGLGSAAKVMGFVGGACWMIVVVTTGRMRKPTPLIVATAIFVMWNAVTVLWSPDPGASVLHTWTWMQCLILVCILWDVYRTRAALLAGLQAFVLGVYVAIGFAVINYATSHAFYSYYQRYAPGQQTNPDGFGFTVALGVPVACYLVGSEGITRWSRLFRVLNLTYVPAAFFGIALSGTRTAAIAGVFGLAFGLASLTRLSLTARVAVLVLLAVGLYLLLPVVQPLRSFERLGTTGTELTQGTWNGRLDAWRVGFASFVDHPVLGIGSGMYRTIDASVDQTPNGAQPQGKLAHNSFLSVLVELGLVGFSLFLVILGIVIANAMAQPKWERLFWLTLLTVWAIGASSLTWEYRKTTWLILPLVVVSAALTPRRDRVARSVPDAAPALSEARRR